MIKKSPLEAWIHQKIFGVAGGALTTAQLEQYQVRQLNAVIAKVKKESRFYREHLKDVEAGAISRIEDMGRLPFTTSKDLFRNPNAFSCVSQQQISRVMTISTSGTTGEPKRIFYTAEDQEATIDYFQHGMTNLACAGDRVLILLPSELPGSVGDLLQKALERLGATGIKHGVVVDPEKVLMIMEKEKANVLVGIPVQILILARYQASLKTFSTQLKSILLSTDYVPRAIVRVLEKTWNCRVFNHYGASEMGLGGAVQCEALGGYHLRESDLLFEIVDSNTGQSVPDGEYGEIVFTSLTAQGMPLIRYRTGDISRFIPQPCQCGTVLKTMDLVIGRRADEISLKSGIILRQGDLDEALFPLAGILDFRTSVTCERRKDLIDIEVNLAKTANVVSLQDMYSALENLPGIKSAIDRNELTIQIKVETERFNRGAAKRVMQHIT
ncbi:MAG: hypothetical protein APF81_12215 [Desulfosporosinus sp. BRH_c37]|nr:MAG: hypothetical protein APF81_12215 [Desulfosporosinus sp. BRH_c37]